MTTQIDHTDHTDSPQIRERRTALKTGAKITNTEDAEEQITLSSSEFDQFKEDSKPSTVTSELLQEIAIKEQQKLFRIFDQKYINVNQRTPKGTISYLFKLSMLDPKPKRKRIIKFIPLMISALLFALAWLTFSLKESGLEILATPYTYTAIVSFAVIGLILCVYVVKEFRNVLVFYSSTGRAPVIELLYRLPNKSLFNKFVLELIENIRNEKLKNYYSESQLLAAELSEHRNVRDQGGLSNEQYESAKKYIMKQH